MSAFLASVGFASPWLLWVLVALPVIWILLRVVPPAPILRRFPGVILLLGLSDAENATARTPWWLLLLRVLALALAVLGFAGPILNPDARVPGKGPLLRESREGRRVEPLIRCSPLGDPFSGSSQRRPKIILPAVVCSTLVTATSAFLPISRRALSTTTIVPSSR